jgi:hypothetical protein
MPDTGPVNPQPQFVDVFEARYLGRAVRRHGAVVLAAAVIGALAGAGLRLTTPPVYRAEAVLQVNIQAVRIGADGVPMDVELIPPARRTVGTICQSDAVMTILSARLEGGPEPAWPTADELAEMVGDRGHKAARTRPIRDLHGELYFDQRSQELAVLRATDGDPGEAARIANTWAQVCRRMLVMAYGTVAQDVQDIERQAESVKEEVLRASSALQRLGDNADAAERLERSVELERLQKLLSALNTRWAQLRVREDDSEQIVRIVSPASPPARPINPSAWLVVGLFTLAGVLFGFVVALLRGPGP